MKKLRIISLVLVITLVFSFSAVAQNNKVEVNPSDETENVRAGGGFSIGMINLDVSSLNNILQDAGFAKLDENVLMYGGGGIGGKKMGYRFGGLGTGGSLKSTNSNNDKKAVLDIGYGGFVVEKGIYSKDKIDVAWSGLIGAGDMQLTLIHNEPGPFEEVVTGVNQSNDPYSVTMTKSFFTIEPGINMHYQINDLVGLDLAAGYLFTFDMGEDWNIKDETVNDGPLSNISSPHLSVQLSFGF